MMKKNNIIILSIAVLLIISGFLGYTYYNDVTTLKNAKVTIEDMQLQDLKITYCKLKIYIDISNPTDSDISELTAVFNIYIANNFVGSGSFSKISIPAQSSREKEVTITIYYANVAIAVVDGIKNGDFDLTLKGEVSGKALFGLITVKEQFIATQAYL